MSSHTMNFGVADMKGRIGVLACRIEKLPYHYWANHHWANSTWRDAVLPLRLQMFGTALSVCLSTYFSGKLF